MLLGRVGRCCSDSVLLQRIIPLLLTTVDDPAAAVRVTALRCMSALVSLVAQCEPVELQYFPQYIFPVVSRFCKDSELVVRLTFAEVVGTLACTAKRFLDLSHNNIIPSMSEIENRNTNNADVSFKFHISSLIDNLPCLLVKFQ
jgi:hypothetical protein